jgi:hypothetical protein
MQIYDFILKKLNGNNLYSHQSSLLTFILISRNRLRSTTFLDLAFPHCIRTYHRYIPSHGFLMFKSATSCYDDKTLFVLCFRPAKYRQFTVELLKLNHSFIERLNSDR